MIYEFDGFKPVIHESAFIHPNATITGNVIIGRDVYVGPGAAIRGDWGGIIIEDGCNVQENCTVHMFPGVTVILVEHDMKLVMSLSDHIIVLDYGRKLAEGTADQVRNDPSVIEAYLGAA